MPKFSDMRRPRQALSGEEALEVLGQESTGVLATVNEEGDPRATGINYALLDEKTLVFHGSRVGEKMNNIRHHANVSLFVTTRDEIIPNEFTTNYKSVSVNGRAEVIEGDDAYPYLLEMTKKLDAGPSEEMIHDYVYPHLIGKVAVVLFHIEHLTGKVGSHSPEAMNKTMDKEK